MKSEKIYLVMMWGDDYHGSFPVKAFHSKEEARKFAKHEGECQVSSCGSETCTHKYMFLVHDIELS